MPRSTKFEISPNYAFVDIFDRIPDCDETNTDQHNNLKSSKFVIYLTNASTN